MGLTQNQQFCSRPTGEAHVTNQEPSRQGGFVVGDAWLPSRPDGTICRRRHPAPGPGRHQGPGPSDSPRYDQTGTTRLCRGPALQPRCARLCVLRWWLSGHFRGGLELFEGAAHGALELPLPPGQDISDADPPRDPLDLVGLHRDRAALAGLEAIPPYGRVAACFLGGERELTAGVGSYDSAPAGPPEQVERAAPVVAGEGRSLRRAGGFLVPLDSLAFGTPLAHPGQVGD